MKFTIQATDNQSKARRGKLFTDHGTIETPIFMPVGTLGNVKAVFHRDLLDDIKAQIILGNTYHLYLRPGTEIMQKAGGLHKFCNWNKPILTDSGGYQVYSLADRRKITEDGVVFHSHIDGSKHLFTPESVMDIQRIIGADIVMAFDECTPYPCEFSYAEKSLTITQNWLKRCVDRINITSPIYGHNQSLFPIVQGSTFPELRKQSAEFVAEIESDGYAIGGLSVGEPVEMMYDMTDLVCDILPQNKPRYLMGVGTPANILESISRGVDMFDCVMPTRNARNGMLFTSNGIINIKNEKWKADFSPIDEEGTSFVDKTYTKAYLRHLIVTGEILSGMIASLHNLSFYLWLVSEARFHIELGDFTSWKNQILPKLMQRL